MTAEHVEQLLDQLEQGVHADHDYFQVIKELVVQRNQTEPASAPHLFWQEKIDLVYAKVADEIKTNTSPPLTPVKFGTSGWRGIIGKDINVHTVKLVTRAIAQMYLDLQQSQELAGDLGITSLDQARSRGAVIGFDNRFGNPLYGQVACDVLTSLGFTVYFAGESTTGVLSAAVLELGAAFSINLTPSHNPLEYAGFKYNPADGGPAADILTSRITELTQTFIQRQADFEPTANPALVKECDSLALWLSLIKKNRQRHGLDFEAIMKKVAANNNVILAVDCVHGATRVHLDRLLALVPPERVVKIRNTPDPTFGGVAPEPSTANMAQVRAELNRRPQPLKIGIIMDPDGDRIRFTDGTTDINMNFFGAMAYHFLHEEKGKKGMVAKTVATSNMANAMAADFGEEIFEPKVGFKEFRPVINRALVCFEESDGITVIGHTPEKDAYVGLVLALDMVLSRQQNLGDYLQEIAHQYGFFFPAKDGVTVSRQGAALQKDLDQLKKYGRGSSLLIGAEQKKITEVIDIDGLKLIFEDQSWLLIRPSGTEPKVRFYVESRTESGKNDLFEAAKAMLKEIGLL
ncbi:MAG: phosphoglucomutase [Deltaproteobacteria bacterium]|jgi:phosphomannomutase|nr:phosphoglucomutase [Deltaproteobacteria bacterium]